MQLRRLSPVQNEIVREELFKFFVSLFEYSQDRYGTTTCARILLDAIQNGSLDVDLTSRDAEEMVRLNSEDRDISEEQFDEYIRDRYEASSRRASLADFLDRIQTAPQNEDTKKPSESTDSIDFGRFDFLTDDRDGSNSSSGDGGSSPDG